MGVNRLNVVTIVVANIHIQSHSHPWLCTPTHARTHPQTLSTAHWLTDWLAGYDIHANMKEKKATSRCLNPCAWKHISQATEKGRKIDRKAKKKDKRKTKGEEEKTTATTTPIIKYSIHSDCLFIIIISVSDNTVCSILVFLLYTAVTLNLPVGIHLYTCCPCNNSIITIRVLTKWTSKPNKNKIEQCALLVLKKK